MLKAISRKTRLVDEKVKGTSRLKGEDISTPYFFDHLASPEDVQVTVREEDFVAAQRELVASVRLVVHFTQTTKFWVTDTITVQRS
jgi:peroxin-6